LREIVVVKTFPGITGQWSMQDTKERIMSVSLKLFARDGYEAVSVRTIAGQLGVTQGALYKHYKNKRDILDAL
jgi:AcrR family transcriptional regulator